MAHDPGGERSAEGPARRLLDAIESRDLRRIAAALSPDSTWQNVPHEVHAGRDAVVALVGGIVCWSDRVAWDVTTAAYAPGLAALERVDRFWIDGAEHAVSCHGVFTVDSEVGVVTAVRDYVDLGEWRDRVGPALVRMAKRPPPDVVARHLAAVERGDPVAMAADYALDAVLDRGGERHEGWAAIADYFESVPGRLQGSTLQTAVLAEPPADPEADVVVAWRVIENDGGGVLSSGTDAYAVAGGRIVNQLVQLDAADF
jgi:limonene-1,2-epoxide hydrolase